jgi:uncharacterized protein
LYRFNKPFSVSQFLSLVLLSLLLSACASTPDSSSHQAVPPSGFSRLDQKSEWYLDQLAQADVAYRFTWETLAARSLIASGDLQQATALSQQLAKEAFTPRQKDEQRIVQAMILQQQGKVTDALTQLTNIDLRPLPDDTTASYYKLQASLLSQTNRPLDALSAYVALDAYLPTEEQKTNHETTWSLLLAQDTSTLQQALNAPGSEIQQGWLALAILQKTLGNKPQQFAVNYAQWQKRYPNHPGSESYKKETSPAETSSSLASGMPKQVAILIPLSGNLAAQGDALRNGMLTAYKEAGLQGDLRFYDSASQPIATLYQQAQTDGAEFIVGPLLKEQVETLIAQKPALPMLALNETDGKTTSSSVFYFSLSPAADAAEAAEKLHQDGRRLPLLIVPQGVQGQRVVDGFTNQWQPETGGAPLVARFTDRQSLEAVLRQAMGVGASQQRIDSLQKSIGQKVFAQPFNRQDVDAIYLYASPLEAGIIKSFIDVSQSPFANAPIYYLGAKGNPGFNNPGVAQNVLGMQLGDMPWMIDQSSPLRDKVIALWPQANNDLLRFFAMGYDAISLVPHLADLRAAPEQQLDGLTGSLSINQQGAVRRKLHWITIEKSEPSHEPATPVSAPAAQ